MVLPHFGGLFPLPASFEGVLAPQAGATGP